MHRFGSNLLLTLLMVACGGSTGSIDGGSGSDGGVDAGTPVGTDAGPDMDAGTNVDAGGDRLDGGGADDAGASDAAASDAGTDAAADGGFDACVRPPCPAPPMGCNYVGTDPCVCGELVCDGTPCTDDAECPGGFCRATMDSMARACHPYSAEGDSCGGFTVPWGVSRCDPATHICMGSSPLIADAPGVCLLEVTVAELNANPMAYEGHVIGLRTSWVSHGGPGCTEIACSPSMPCCNSCFASMFASDAMLASERIDLEDMSGMAYECTGDECMPTAMCTVAPDAEYRIIGTFTGTAIEVRSIQRVTFGP